MIKSVKWAGPALVTALLVTAVVYPLLAPKPGPATVGGCTARPDTVRAISGDPMLTRHPAAADLDKAAEESLTCGGGETTGIRLLAAGVVGAHLSAQGINVPAFYADLAAKSGWQADRQTSGLFSATRPDGACPWWFVLSSAKEGGYRVRVYYQPDGAPADSCAWGSGDAHLIPILGGD